MVSFSKYIVAPIHHPRKRRSLRDLAAAVLLLAGVLQAQELKFGDPDLFNTPFGTKIIDVGFKNWNYLNVNTVRPTDYLLLRWHAPDSTTEWLIRVGVPKCSITDSAFALINLFDLDVDPDCFNWLIQPIPAGQANEWLLRVAKFDYVVQVISPDLYYRSQYRLIKQKYQ